MLASINFHLLGNGPHAGRNVKDLLDGFLHAHEVPELVNDPGVCVLSPHVCNVVGELRWGSSGSKLWRWHVIRVFVP